MRPIKFRAWDKKKQEWLNDSWLKYVCPNDGVVALVTYAPNNRGGYDPKSCRQLTNPEVDNLEITQFTGLLDKNGKEIYESDILLIPDEAVVPITDDGQGPIEPCNHIVPVEFREGSFSVQIPKTDDGETGWFTFERLKDYFGLADLEIIGNAYETPELINPA